MTGPPPRWVLLDHEVTVARKGTPDPPGSRYCLIDYAHSGTPGQSAVIAMLAAAQDREPAYCTALAASVQGEAEQPVLLQHEIQTDLNVHPDARWLVCNVSRHYPARVAAQRYAIKVRDADPVLAGLIFALLQETAGVFAEHLHAKTEAQKAQAKRLKGRKKKW